MEKMSPSQFQDIFGYPSHEYQDRLAEAFKQAEMSVQILNTLCEAVTLTEQEAGKTEGHWIPDHNLVCAWAAIRKADASLSDAKELLRRKGCPVTVLNNHQHTNHLERIL